MSLRKFYECDNQSCKAQRATIFEFEVKYKRLVLGVPSENGRAVLEGVQKDQSFQVCCAECAIVMMTGLMKTILPSEIKSTKEAIEQAKIILGEVRPAEVAKEIA